MLEISKTETYSVITYKGKAIIGTGKTEKEALENYLKKVDNALCELEDGIVKLKDYKKEAEELLKDLKQ